MKVEELLIPRYKVIADYPKSVHRIGEILTYIGVDGRFENSRIMKYEKDLEMYPALFRKLNWWEERKVEDMPEYVKPIVAPDYIFKVTRFTQDEYCYFIGNNGKEIGEFISRFEPATEQQYNDYINSKSNAKP